jgi:excisionase family DNA binding protein
MLSSPESNSKEKVMVPLTQRLTLTLPECAALTGLKVCALRAAIWDGKLAFVRLGPRSRYVIRRESLEQFLRAGEKRETA